MLNEYFSRFFIIKPTRCTNFPNLLRHETLHVSGVPLPIIRSLFTVHSAMVYVIQVWRQLSSRTRMALLESCLQTCMTYTSAECTVNKLLMMGRGTARNIEFHARVNLGNWCIWLVLLQRNLLRCTVTWT